MTHYGYLYDSEKMNQVVITESMLKFIKKHYTAIDFIDCKTGKVNTIILDDCFNCKNIIINF